MANCYTCPECGANLDFGEKCDCMDIKRAAVQKEQATTNQQSNNIIRSSKNQV